MRRLARAFHQLHHCAQECVTRLLLAPHRLLQRRSTVLAWLPARLLQLSLAPPEMSTETSFAANATRSAAAGRELLP